MKKIFALIILCALFIPAAFCKSFVTTEDVNIRKGAGTDYDEVGVIKKGTTIDVTDIKGTWGKVEYEDVKGYVSTKYLDDEVTAPSTGKTNWLVIAISVLAGGGIVFFILKRVAIAKALASKKEELLKHAHMPALPQMPHIHSDGLSWYCCEHCSAVAKSIGTPEESLGCPNDKGKPHTWHKLAELGETHYQCEICGILINAHKQPATAGCYKDVGKLHKWEKL